MITARNILIGLNKVCNGDWDDIYYHIRHQTDMDFEKILDGVDTSKYITLMDKDYPEHLRNVPRPPFVIDRAEYNIK